MSSLFRRLRSGLMLLCAGALAVTVQAQSPTYQPVQPPQPTQVPAGRIEVLEFFWYGCPHCYTAEPLVEQWLQGKPANVEFIRVPGVLNKIWMPHARAYYTAQKLGVLEKIHRPLFDAMHRERRKIFSEDELREFFEEKGVKGDDFTRVYNSHEVEIRIKQAYVQAQNYRLTGVPAFTVNGRYLTSAQLAGSYENIFATIDMLIAQESGAAETAAPETAP